MEERTLTIKIRYYPIPKRTLASSIFIICFYFLGFSFQPIVDQWMVEHQSQTMVVQLPKFYSAQYLAAALAQEKPQEKMSVQQPSIKNDHVINNGPRDSKQVALTFDADMTPQMKKDLEKGVTKSSYNEKIVEILNQTQTKATIFTSGMWIEQYPEVTKELAANPLFEFGNHSYSHPGFDGDCWGLTPLPDSGNEQELQKTQELLKEYTGKDNKFFRFPGGCYAKKDLEDVWEKGMYVVHWDSVGNDGFNDDASKIENNVLSSAQNGSVIVLHFNGYPNSPKTAYALPTIIAQLKQRGFEFVKLSELLGLNGTPSKKLIFSDFLRNIGYN